MNILIINTYDDIGGAAKASVRIFNSISKFSGLKVNLLVRNKTLDEKNVIGFNSFISKIFNFFVPYLDRIPLRKYKNAKVHFWNVGWFPNSIILKKIIKINPDIIQLHWISEGFLPIRDLAKVARPIIWRLSDSWAFTGGCHVPFDCKNYMRSCGNCPQLNSKKENDLSRKTLNKKKKYWEKLDLTIVAPSNWMADCVRSSDLFKNRKVVVIYPGVDTTLFRPRDKSIIKKELGLNDKKRYIVFGAIKSTEDINKGFHLLKDALVLLKQNLKEVSDIEILILGSSSPLKPIDLGFKSNYISRITDEITLALYYSVAEVFVLPSLKDNSPNTVIESLSCGIPVVSFGACGALDMVSHKLNGYLADPYKTEELSKGIEWILTIGQLDYKTLSENARTTVLEKFDIEYKAKEYIELYSQVLN